MEEGWWCRNIATWFEYRRVSEQGDFARADELMAEPACPHVLHPLRQIAPAHEQAKRTTRPSRWQTPPNA